MNLSTESRMSNSSCFVLSTPAHHRVGKWLRNLVEMMRTMLLNLWIPTALFTM